MSSRRVLALVASAPLVLALAACGGDDATPDVGGPVTAAPPASSAAPSSAAPSSPAPSSSTPTTSAPPVPSTEAPVAGAGDVPAYTVAREERDEDDGVLDVDLDVDVQEVLTEDQVRALVADLQGTYTEEAVYDLSVDCGVAGPEDDVAEADWAVGAAAQRESGLAEGEVRVELERDAVCG